MAFIAHGLVYATAFGPLHPLFHTVDNLDPSHSNTARALTPEASSESDLLTRIRSLESRVIELEVRTNEL